MVPSRKLKALKDTSLISAEALVEMRESMEPSEFERLRDSMVEFFEKILVPEIEKAQAEVNEIPVVEEGNASYGSEPEEEVAAPKKKDLKPIPTKQPTKQDTSYNGLDSSQADKLAKMLESAGISTGSIKKTVPASSVELEDAETEEESICSDGNSALHTQILTYLDKNGYEIDKLITCLPSLKKVANDNKITVNTVLDILNEASEV